MNIEDIKKIINKEKVHKIRSWTKHNFIDISIIELEWRFFIRPYKFWKNWWYNAFIKNPNWEIQVWNLVFKITWIPPSDLDDLNKKLNWAYRKKLPIIYDIMRLWFDSKKHEKLTLELIINL